MSSHEQFGRLSPPPFYHHSPLTDAAPSTLLSFMLGPPRTQAHQQANPGPPSSSNQPDDMYYVAKYKDMKRKVKEIELDNDRLHLKCLKAQKNIQRLRLERAILYESLSTMPIAELNASSVTSSQLPGAHPYPSPDLIQGHQGVHQQVQFSPGGQARAHPDPSRMPSEAVHHARLQHQHPLIHGVDPERPPHRPCSDSPSISYQQPGVLTLGNPHPVTKHRQRKSKGDATVEKNRPFSPNTHHEVRNGGSRTFPFVHEYSSAQEQVDSVFAPSEYPSEIRFHQYEALSERRPVNRSRRDIDRDTEKVSKHKRRPQPDIEKDRRRHPGSRSCSPTGPPPHGTYAFPIQFMSTERESQPCPAQGDERVRDPKATKIQPGEHFDGSSQQDAESKCFGTREGDEICIRHENLAEAEGEKARDSAWHPPSEKKKRVYSQMVHEDHYPKERDERDDSNRIQRRMPPAMGRADDDVCSLPRVREGEVMD